METPEETSRRPYRPSLGLILCLLLIPGLGYLALPKSAHIYPVPKGRHADEDLSGIGGAIQTFRAEYGYWPVSPATASLTNRDFTFGTVGTGARCVITNGFGKEANNSEIVRILTAVDENGHLRNPRKNVYLNAKFVRATNSPGIGPDFVYRDPWGNPYIITLDLNGDGQCDDCIYHVKGGFSIWSFGPDGKASVSELPGLGVNKDNVVTFRQ